MTVVRRALVVVAAVAAMSAGAALPARAEWEVPTRLDVTLFADSLQHGQQVAVEAQLTRTDTGEPVGYQTVSMRLVGGQWAVDATLDPNGTAFLAVEAIDDVGDYVLEARFDSGPGWAWAPAVATLPLTITRAATWLQTSTPPNAYVGLDMGISGSLLRNGPYGNVAGLVERPVTLDVLDAQGTVAWTAATTTGWDGEWGVGFVADLPEGDYTWRVSYPGETNFEPAEHTAPLRIDRNVSNGLPLHPQRLFPEDTGMVFGYHPAWQPWQPAPSGQEISFRLLDGETTLLSASATTGEPWNIEAWTFLEDAGIAPGQYVIETSFAGDEAWTPFVRRDPFVKFADAAVPVYVGDTAAYAGETYQAAWRVVRRSDGTPLPGVTVHVQASGGVGSDQVADADGVVRYTATAIPGSGSPWVYANVRDSGLIGGTYAQRQIALLPARSVTKLTPGPQAEVTRGDQAPVSARLLRANGTPVAGATVTFGDSVTATTGADGWARATVPAAGLAYGLHSVEVRFAGTGTNRPASATATVFVRRVTAVTWLGDVTGTYGKTVPLRARVTDAWDGSPIAGRLVAFAVGGTTVSAFTGADGVAEVAHTVTGEPGEHTVTVNVAPDHDLPSSTTGRLVVGWQYEFRGADPDTVVRLNPATKQLQVGAPGYTSPVIRNDTMTVRTLAGQEIVDLDVREGDLTVTGFCNLTTGQFSVTWTARDRGAWSAGRT